MIKAIAVFLACTLCICLPGVCQYSFTTPLLKYQYEIASSTNTSGIETYMLGINRKMVKKTTNGDIENYQFTGGETRTTYISYRNIKDSLEVSVVNSAGFVSLGESIIADVKKYNLQMEESNPKKEVTRYTFFNDDKTLVIILNFNTDLNTTTLACVYKRKG
jgi:hypothetical protein